jgi:hypothetical protein
MTDIDSLKRRLGKEIGHLDSIKKTMKGNELCKNLQRED